LALNYRCFTGEIGKLKEKFVEIVSKYNDGTLEIIHGAKILEVRPKGWNKGTAVEMILKKIPNAMPIYIGDDRTDEDAFNYINSIDGITIIANEKEANAKFYLRGQREVLSFLNILSEWSD
jgi:trehalose-phosphatase